jgi:rod shape determining protein RodA
MGIISSQLKKLDWGIIVPVILLACFSLAAIWSTCVAKNNFSNFEKQAIFFAVGFLVMITVSFFDYKILKNNSYLILILYAICLLLLAGLHFFAPMIRGTRGWYKVGILSLDPIEPTKIVLVVLLAKYFSMRHVEMYKFKHIIFSGIYILLPALLIFIKPDLGGTTVILLIWLGILLVSGIKIKHFLILALCFVLVSGFAWNFLTIKNKGLPHFYFLMIIWELRGAKIKQKFQSDRGKFLAKVWQKGRKFNMDFCQSLTQILFFL